MSFSCDFLKKSNLNHEQCFRAQAARISIILVESEQYLDTPTLKGQSHEKVGEERVWGVSLGHK
jgi:hypothetical protein